MVEDGIGKGWLGENIAIRLDEGKGEGMEFLNSVVEEGLGRDGKEDECIKSGGKEGGSGSTVTGAGAGASAAVDANVELAIGNSGDDCMSTLRLGAEG